MAVYVELTFILDAVMGNSKSDIRHGGKQFAFVSDDVTYACAASPRTLRR